MADRRDFALWWAAESQRGFTKLECGLLGGLFSAIGIMSLMTVRFLIG